MAQNESESVGTVGAYIRHRIIPANMSVKEAAKRLGVGRPALSNLLNGNASLSPEMALRLEKAFGANRQELLDLQARSDRDGQRADEKGVAVRAYVPHFLTIKARQIHDWAEGNHDARNQLPVLLRRLIHSTGHELRHVDFPGYDNAERKGWDGVIEAEAATPWIPDGKSGWEFGVNQNPGAKADKDYAARVTSVPAAERATRTFVFVTPRNWPGKTAWVKEKNAAGDWKAARALDASDLEQWLEESIPAQIWLAEKLAMPVTGFETLDRCWERWAAASEPQMMPEIFEPSITAHRAAFKNWLEKDSDRPFIIAADSRDESLAFLACLFQDTDTASRSKDLPAVFESAQTLRTLAPSSSPFIPVVTTDEAERELATIYRRHHCIVVRPRNAVDSEPDIALDLLRHEPFEKALAAMGITGDDADRLARESGRSPTILRRRLSKIDAIKRPHWARDAEIAKSLIPMTLIGAWNAKAKADGEVVSVLAGRPYQEIEETVTRLLQFDDCPVWSAGQYRGVASKIDALFAISKFVTEKDLAEFFMLAEYVLSELDPALDLPEDQRWAAGIYGKLRDHSAALREGVCETLVILSVHGNNLFKDRLGIDADARVGQLIQRLLTPLTLDKLMSHDRDLPRYAEAAPDVFLNLLETDLKQAQPVVLGLLRPASAGIFGSCPRTGLLWALECLAWKPQNLPRVTTILAQLSRTKINDNWANKPIGSLGAIYRSWMPQTAASLEERSRALELLSKRYPDAGWQICIDQFSPGSRMGDYSYRPRWRSDASGAGQPVVTRKEIFRFSRKALDLALAWSKHDETTLGDLVERLEGMPKEDQAATWDLIDAWASNAQTHDKAKAVLRERIRRFALTRLGRRRGLEEATRDRAREAYTKLEPRDPVIRHAWLFANQWVEESADELDDDDLDFSKREERIHALRIAALNEIWSGRGFDGVAALLADSRAPLAVGQCAALCVTVPEARVDFLERCLSILGDLEQEADACIQGFLWSVEAEARGQLLPAIANGSDTNSRGRLFKCAPFAQETWRMLDTYALEIREKYWQEVFPQWNCRHSEAELSELVDRLLEAKRPRAAFHTVHMDWARLETSRLKRLLTEVATVGAEPAGTLQLSAHDISAALQSLDGRAGVTPDDMAQMEFRFISALDHAEHGIPNLECQIAESPIVFAQAVALTYKRSDGGEDPPEWRIEDPDRRSGVASAMHRLLDQIRRIPGTGSDRKIDAGDLTMWLTQVRELCAQCGRAEIADHCIGGLLSKAPPESTGVWPCLPVCEAMERIASQDIAKGFIVGVHNARGAHWRGEGGGQERELAAKYRGWSQQLAFDYPYVGSVLESIAASYDREAEWHDSEAKVSKRLRH
jgi:addiction module HigA family antidote